MKVKATLLIEVEYESDEDETFEDIVDWLKGEWDNVLVRQGSDIDEMRLLDFKIKTETVEYWRSF
jgi:hypothetical protein